MNRVHNKQVLKMNRSHNKQEAGGTKQPSQKLNTGEKWKKSGGVDNNKKSRTASRKNGCNHAISEEPEFGFLDQKPAFVDNGIMRRREKKQKSSVEPSKSENTQQEKHKLKRKKNGTTSDRYESPKRRRVTKEDKKVLIETTITSNNTTEEVENIESAKKKKLFIAQENQQNYWSNRRNVGLPSAFYTTVTTTTSSLNIINDNVFSEKKMSNSSIISEIRRLEMKENQQTYWTNARNIDLDYTLAKQIRGTIVSGQFAFLKN